MPAGRLLLAALAVALAAPARADDDPARAVEARVRRVIDRAAAGVVAVVVSQNPEHLPLPDGAPQPLKLGAYTPDPKRAARLDLSDPRNAADYTLGSGVVLDPAGLVLTNYHLIDGARKVFVRAASGAGCYADIHAADARSDLAVLRLLDPPAGLVAPPVARGRTAPGPGGERANLSAGMSVVTLAHSTPAAAGDGTPVAGWGALSGVRRRLAAPNPNQDDGKNAPLSQFSALLQFDARAAPACPGGGVFNLDGELVGLSAPAAALAGADAGGGFAVPMDPNYRRIIEVLRAGREVEYGFLGISMYSLNPPVPKPWPPGRADPDPARGLAIRAVTRGGPADLAGLVGQTTNLPGSGDVILAVDGNRVLNSDDLFLNVGAALAGARVEVEVRDRAGRRRRVTATLGKLPHDQPKLASTPPPGGFGVRADWASALTGRDGLAAVPAGVHVSGFDPDAPAAAKFAALPRDPAGPPAAWLVVAVDNKRISSPDEFAAACRGKAAATLTVADAARPGWSAAVTLP